jgi:hypothetical protein
VRKLAVPTVRGERLGELAGEDGVDHLVLLLPDGRVYPTARLRAHRHQAASGPRRPCGGKGRGGDGEAASGGSGAERGCHGSWLVARLVWCLGGRRRTSERGKSRGSDARYVGGRRVERIWRVCGDHMPRRRAHQMDGRRSTRLHQLHPLSFVTC